MVRKATDVELSRVIKIITCVDFRGSNMFVIMCSNNNNKDMIN